MAWRWSLAIRGRAKKGREALKVAWDESGAESRGTDQLMAEYKRLAKSGEGALPAVKHGDAAAALKGATKVVDAEFEMPFLAHAPMEPLTAACSLSADRCEIWAGCQFQTIDQLNAAARLRAQAGAGVHQHDCGGWHVRPPREHRIRLHRGSGVDRQGDGWQVSACGSSGRARTIWLGGRYRPLNYHRVTAGLSARREDRRISAAGRRPEPGRPVRRSQR